MKRTRSIVIWLLALALAACVAPAATPTVRPMPPTPTWPLATMVPMQGPTLVLVNATLIDGTGAEPVPDAAVLIVQGRIMDCGPRSRVTIPAQTTVIDAGGGTILPGLINAHVHQGYDAAHLQAWASAGVTTVRDLGTSSADPFTRRNALQGDPHNARLVAAGPFITVPDGYPIVPWGGSGRTVTSVAEAEAATLGLLDEGADVIKISLEAGGTFQREIPVLTTEQAAAIVRVAHERGTRVAAHITGAEDVSRCVAAGVDDIAHMPGNALSSEQAAQVVEAGLYWVPTLELWHNVNSSLGRLAVNNLRRFLAAGGTVALGTDYAGYDAEFDLGLPIREMEWMLEAGMTPMQVIVAATRNAAHVCNLDRELGTVEVGKIADVLVVNGDPLQDIHALQDVRTVIHNGQVIR